MTTTRTTLLQGRYQLGELLGHGGMGDVHRARDLVLDREVAVKVLRNSADPALRARFEGEAKTLAQLRHPHVVALLDAGLQDEVPHLVMDLVEGSTLSAVLAGGPLTADRARRIGREIAGALAYAHAAGVVHRDVKPSNILLDTADHAYLTDFGIARLVEAVEHHTRTDELVGSPAYLAPEQVDGSAGVTPATDVYSLGLVLLESLTGRRAYTGTAVETAIARLSTPPLIPTSLGAGLGNLLERMTRREPTDRPTAAEVVSALDPDRRAGATDVVTITGPLHLPPLEPAGTTAVLPPAAMVPPAEAATPGRRRRRAWYAAGAATA
ncbi:serine/threonine-protein kinase, partial [Marmoricola sp. RAF53]|uniref:serine/threonine-protein kinase n=1 Tax=Marmoricola sp. RAF53 TaxID=3233059 RepID=UPI003F9C1E01